MGLSSSALFCPIISFIQMSNVTLLFPIALSYDLITSGKFQLLSPVIMSQYNTKNDLFWYEWTGIIWVGIGHWVGAEWRPSHMLQYLAFAARGQHPQGSLQESAEEEPDWTKRKSQVRTSVNISKTHRDFYGAYWILKCAFPTFSYRPSVFRFKRRHKLKYVEKRAFREIT